MRIALGSDHRGNNLRRVVLAFLGSKGIEVCEPGLQERTTVDYPDVASEVALTVCRGDADFGILICGTGVGMCMVANKFFGIRAVSCCNDVTAELSRRHNNANVLCLSGDLLGERTCLGLVDKWLGTDFDGGRHQRRLDKINVIEKEIIR
ncbi:MAG: ribose 5-phosphate isomerase B [Thermoguttaceae bacterium]